MIPVWVGEESQCRMNENHRRVLAAYLEHVEKNLDTIRTELRHEAKDDRHVLYTVRHDVNEDARAVILRDASSMLSEVRLMKGFYEFQQRDESSRRRVRAALLEIRDTLYDLRPKSLENYGSMNARDREALVPKSPDCWPCLRT